MSRKIKVSGVTSYANDLDPSLDISACSFHPRKMVASETLLRSYCRTKVVVIASCCMYIE